MSDELKKYQEGKTRFKENTSYLEGQLAWEKFNKKNQLAKGKIGEIRNDAEYYWCEHEGRTLTPKSYRYPIYRTNLTRPQKFKDQGY
jgi:hypothetical protein